MKLLHNKDNKKLFFTFIIILLTCFAFGLFFIQHMTDYYKQSIMKHDYGIAGFLFKNGTELSEIAKAFTRNKTISEVEAGTGILREAGYTPNTSTFLLPDVQAFQKNFTFLFSIFFIMFSIIILSVLFMFLTLQQKKFEKANANIRAFMDGDIDIRLDDQEEGSLSQLFSSVNVMATSLTTHNLNEKHGREFLKDTISDISHQLNTPLTALKMYNEIIQNEETGSETVDKFTQKSERELIRMEVLIQNLLKLAKLDAGSIALERTSHNLKEFLEDVIMGFRTRAELEHKTICLECDEAITMSFDEEWLLEAVSNIIKNALDHMEADNKTLVCCHETLLITEIIVKDEGMGIHPEDINWIFKRFYRSRFSKNKQGIGIGLTLSKVIVEKHDGVITVESELGSGTTFHLTFPKLSKL